MARTLILNISALAQTMPAVYGGYVVSVGHGRVVSDETSVAVAEMGGFAAIDGKWVVYPVSTDTMEGDYDVAAGGLALLATFVPSNNGNGNGGPVYWADILNKPAFANVATDGDYNSLNNKPALADVAESGLYSDLSGTPTIPSASNASSTNVGSTGSAGVASAFARGDHQHAHGNLGGGSMHSSATTVAAGFMSAADKTKLDGLENFSGDYGDLTNTPDLSGFITGVADGSVTTAKIADGAVTDAKVTSVAAAKVTGLAAVATDGSYNSLSNKPDLSAYLTAVPDASVTTAKLADGAVTNAKVTSVAAAKVTGLAAVATSGSANDLSNQPYDFAANAVGELTVNQIVLRIIAPRALVLQSLAQASTTTAVIELRVNGTAASFPQSVAQGALITAVVTTAGTNCWFSITGKVA